MSAQLSYDRVVHEIESRGVMPDSPPDLKQMRQGLERLLPGIALNPSRTIVVAGTNGKGSVCASLEALLLAAGQTVGLFTSPHLEDTTERIRIQGQDISKDDFCHVYGDVVERTQGLTLTHFEILTLMAVWAFFSQERPQALRVNWVILEVGLGGTWDATNAVLHDHCVITTLGYDHQNLLGSTLQEIAMNKFGIIPAHGKVVHSPLPAEVRGLAEKVRKTTQSVWTESVPFDLKANKSVDGHPPLFTLQTKWGDTRLSLPGQRAAQNSATALTVFNELGFCPQDYLFALGRVRWPGRMERVNVSSCPCPVYLSGDHNPQGISSLIEILSFYPRKRLHLLVGVGKDKDLDGILSPLFSLETSEIYLTEIPFRGRSIVAYGEWATRAQGAWKDPIEAIQHVFARAAPGDLVVVTGSLYLVGCLRGPLRGNSTEHRGLEPAKI